MSSPCVPTKRMRCHPRASVGGLEWGRGRWPSIFSELLLASPRLWLGSSAAQRQRRWAGGGGSSLPGLSPAGARPNLTPQPPPGQLLQSIRRGARGCSSPSWWGSPSRLRRAAEASPESSGLEAPVVSPPGGPRAEPRGGAWGAEFPKHSRERPGRRTEQWRGVWGRLGACAANEGGRQRAGVGRVKERRARPREARRKEDPGVPEGTTEGVPKCATRGQGEGVGSRLGTLRRRPRRPPGRSHSTVGSERVPRAGEPERRARPERSVSGWRALRV